MMALVRRTSAFVRGTGGRPFSYVYVALIPGWMFLYQSLSVSF